MSFIAKLLTQSLTGTSERSKDSFKLSGVAIAIFVLIFLPGLFLSIKMDTPSPAVISGVLGAFVSSSIRIANQWEKIAVLRFGNFIAMKGPGIFFIIPIVETTPYTLYMRLITYDVPKQKSISKDNIPVTVDAIVYYKVAVPEDAVLKVEDYHKATQLGAQTILRDLIGKATLDELLSEREKLSQKMQESLDILTDAWGIKVTNVEIKEVMISEALEDAISREPAAEREKRARLKLAEAEKLAAQTIYEAAQIYEKDPIALQLRSMNMLYEMCMEGKSTVIFVPTETQIGMPAPVGVYGVVDKLKGEFERKIQEQKGKK